MKNLFLTILSFALVLSASAQDKISTKGGEISITPILHGTFVMEYQGLTIYVDPYGGADKFTGQKPADLVLITDIHGDHHNQETLDGLDLSQATVVAPQAVSEELSAGNTRLLKSSEMGKAKLSSMSKSAQFRCTICLKLTTAAIPRVVATDTL